LEVQVSPNRTTDQNQEGDPDLDKEWPRIGSILVLKETKRRLTMAPTIPEASNHVRSQYKPTTAGEN
jgi:hypothetical protein